MHLVYQSQWFVLVGLAYGRRCAVLLAMVWGLMSIASWASVDTNEEENEKPVEVEAEQESASSTDEETSPADDEAPVPESEVENEDFDLDSLLNESGEDDLLQILDQGPDSDKYSKTVNCINASRMRTHEVLSDRFVIIHLSDGMKYLIQFENRCAGLRPNSMIVFNRRSMRLCKNDELRAEMSSSGGAGVWSGPCRIPGFEPITDLQINLLKQGLETERIE